MNNTDEMDDITYIGPDTVEALLAEYEALKKENAELRMKAMTNMERIQTADKKTLAALLLDIHSWGYLSCSDSKAGSPFFTGFGGSEEVERWLDRLEWD